MTTVMTYPKISPIPTDPRSTLTTPQRPGIRERVAYNSKVSATLDPVISETVPGFALEVLAQYVLGSNSNWFVLADCHNVIRHPAEWTLGDLVFVPAQAIQRGSVSQSITGLLTSIAGVLSE